MQELMKAKAKELLAGGIVQKVLAWKKGDFPQNPAPAFFADESQLDEMVYDKFCAANLAKFMVEAKKEDGKTLVFLRPCDTYSYNQLLKENRVSREKAYIIGVGCEGVVAVEEMQGTGLLERCRVCTKINHVIYDELIGAETVKRETDDAAARFDRVEEVEKMTSDERYAFWQNQLSKCIRCNACRNACPSCSCKKCVFDGDSYDTEQKANASSFEEQMFHIIRAYHVAGRCTDCGECARVCPQGIELNLLNRKFIKDINELYGEFQAGADIEALGPLTDFNIDQDPEPSSF
ncbi:MAG: 4Fe-4S dicluster domain-containing protein [Defluviitaleaceae bacterium]|nr:4Fe-4S dicluster domain-containing protein [Defluviitaleaceae bacterium]